MQRLFVFTVLLCCTWTLFAQKMIAISVGNPYQRVVSSSPVYFDGFTARISKKFGASAGIDFRWFKTDRSFRSASVHYSAIGLESIFFKNGIAIPGTTATKGFFLTYNANFCFLRTEIDDPIMAYWGAGYCGGLSFISAESSGITAKPALHSSILGIKAQLGVDFNINRKLVANTEVKFLSNEAVEEGHPFLTVNWHLQLIYKLY